MEQGKKRLKATYPKNLLYAIRGPHEDKEPTELSQDVLNGIRFALSMLSEREQFILKCRYVDGMYLRSIGEQLGIKAERTRQIENEALRKLRTRKNIMFMTLGLEGCIKELNKVEFERGHQIGFNVGYEQGISEAPQGIVRGGKSVTIMSLPIEALCVSKRTHNALSCAGYKKVGDLLELHYRDITHIKNLGPMQRQEVAAGLQYYGVFETEWDFFRPKAEIKE